MVGYGYLLQLLMEWLLLIAGNYFVMGLRDTTMKIYWYKRIIGKISLDFFNNPFSSESGTPANNIPLRDGLNDKEPSATHCRINFPNCLSNYTQGRNIYDLTIHIFFTNIFFVCLHYLFIAHC